MCEKLASGGEALCMPVEEEVVRPYGGVYQEDYWQTRSYDHSCSRILSLCSRKTSCPDELAVELLRAVGVAERCAGKGGTRLACGTDSCVLLPAVAQHRCPRAVDGDARRRLGAAALERTFSRRLVEARGDRRGIRRVCERLQ